MTSVLVSWGEKLCVSELVYSVYVRVSVVRTLCVSELCVTK